MKLSSARCSCRKAGFQPTLTATRGYDHGTFVPLKLAFPDADIPVVQLSLLASLDAKALPWHIFLSKTGVIVQECHDLGCLTTFLRRSV
jgi:hypothetical protein